MSDPGKVDLANLVHGGNERFHSLGDAVVEVCV